MGLKDELHKGIDNAADTLSEAGHRGAADAERSKREIAGKEMTAGEKASSVVNEGKNRVQAEVDRAKRDVRNADR